LNNSTNETAKGTAKVLQHPAQIEDKHVLIAPGEYDLAFLFLRTSNAFKRASITLWFRVITPGPAFEVCLPRHYNCEWVKKGGNFKVRRHSDCVREFIAVTGQPVKRTDRLPLIDRYKNRIILARVRTVKHDSKGNLLHELARYSVIERLIQAQTA
jgi:hypothetical protein